MNEDIMGRYEVACHLLHLSSEILDGPSAAPGKANRPASSSNEGVSCKM
jgi:hypothetical protein